MSGLKARPEGPPQQAAESVRLWLAALIAGREEPPPDCAGGLDLLRRLRLTTLAAFSPGASGELADERRRAFVAAVAMERAAAEAVAMLEDAGVRCVTLKGSAFAAQVLGDPARRSSCDVDLLVRRADLAAVRRIYAGAGVTGALHYPTWYEERWHDHAAFRGLPGAPAVTVEVHWDIVHAGLSALPADELIRESVVVPCTSVRLPAPPLHWQLVLVAAHAAQHYFDARGLLDVALCGRLLGTDAWRAACDAARRSRLGPALYHAVVLSAAWLDWDAPALVAELAPGPIQRELAGRYLRSWTPWSRATWRAVQLGKVGTPLCVSSRLAGVPGMLFALADRPNVYTALDARARRVLPGR